MRSKHFSLVTVSYETAHRYIFETDFRTDILALKAFRGNPFSHLTVNTPKPLWDKPGRSFVSQSVVNLSLPTLLWSEFVGRIMPLPLMDAGKFLWQCDRFTQCPSDSQLLPHSIDRNALNLFSKSRSKAIAFEQEYWTRFTIGSLLIIFTSAERAVDQNWKQMSFATAIF